MNSRHSIEIINYFLDNEIWFEPFTSSQNITMYENVQKEEISDDTAIRVWNDLHYHHFQSSARLWLVLLLVLSLQHPPESFFATTFRNQNRRQ